MTTTSLGTGRSRPRECSIYAAEVRVDEAEMSGQVHQGERGVRVEGEGV